MKNSVNLIQCENCSVNIEGWICKGCCCLNKFCALACRACCGSKLRSDALDVVSKSVKLLMKVSAAGTPEVNGMYRFSGRTTHRDCEVLIYSKSRTAVAPSVSLFKCKTPDGSFRWFITALKTVNHIKGYADVDYYEAECNLRSASFWDPSRAIWKPIKGVGPLPVLATGFDLSPVIEPLEKLDGDVSASFSTTSAFGSVATSTAFGSIPISGLVPGSSIFPIFSVGTGSKTSKSKSGRKGNSIKSSLGGSAVDKFAALSSSFTWPAPSPSVNGAATIFGSAPVFTVPKAEAAATAVADQKVVLEGVNSVLSTTLAVPAQSGPETQGLFTALQDHTEGSLVVKKGDILQVSEVKGLWAGATLNGVTEWFPAAYLEAVVSLTITPAADSEIIASAVVLSESGILTPVIVAPVIVGGESKESPLKEFPQNTLIPLPIPSSQSQSTDVAVSEFKIVEPERQIQITPKLMLPQFSRLASMLVTNNVPIRVDGNIYICMPPVQVLAADNEFEKNKNILLSEMLWHDISCDRTDTSYANEKVDEKAQQFSQECSFDIPMPSLNRASSVSFVKSTQVHPLKTVDDLKLFKDKAGNCAAHHLAFVGLKKSLQLLFQLGVSQWQVNNVQISPMYILYKRTQ